MNKIVIAVFFLFFFIVGCTTNTFDKEPSLTPDQVSFLKEAYALEEESDALLIYLKEQPGLKPGLFEGVSTTHALQLETIAHQFTIELTESTHEFSFLTVTEGCLRGVELEASVIQFYDENQALYQGTSFESTLLLLKSESMTKNLIAYGKCIQG